MKLLRLAAALVFLAPLPAAAQGTTIKSGADSNLATVDSNKNLRVAFGASTRATYIASIGALSCNAANGIAIESSAGTGFKLVGWCANVSAATAGAGINVVVRRSTAVSSGGSTLTAEGTGTTSISKMDPGDSNFGGVARGGALTPGTAGATLDQIGFNTGELGTGTETQPSYTFCRLYGQAGEKLPTVSAGTTNGLSIMLSATGAGGLSTCAVSATIIVE